MPTYGSTNVGGASIDKGMNIGNVSNLVAKAGNEQIKLTWTDPSDLIIGDQKVAEWKGTKVVYKKNSYPVNENDGVLAVDVQTRNQYSTNAYILSGLDNGDTYYIKLFPYTKTGLVTNDNDNRVSATPVATRIYGVKRLISQLETTWERTDDAIGLVANATHDGTTATNDFDSLYPWSDIITVDISADGTINKRMGETGFSLTNPTGHIMTYFPEFWWKRIQENGYEKVYIADHEMTGFNYSEAFYIGRYNASGSSSAVTTKSGVAPLTGTGMTNLRTYSRNIGTNWGLMDIWRWSMLQILYLVEYADYNSQDKLGYGDCNGSEINSGQCDSLGMKSGTTNNNKAHAVIYRGVENIFGNIYQWLDGINIKSYKSWVCKNRSNYESNRVSSPYVQLGYTEPSSGGYISTMGYDSNYPEVQRATACSGSDSTYCPDFFYSYSSTHAVSVGGYYNDGLACGLWFASYGSATDTYRQFGGRLLFIPA